MTRPLESGATVVVLHNAVPPDAAPDEQDALVEAETVRAALVELGHESVLVPCSLALADAAAALRDARPSLVFNLVESVCNDGRLIILAPALLEHLRLPYTGSPLDAVYLTSNKLLGKQLLRDAGIRAPAGCPLRPGGPLPDFAGPYIVKSVWEDASIALDDASVVTDRARLGAAVERLDPAHGPYFVEEFVDGRELNISLLAAPGGGALEPLPVAEIRFDAYPEGKPRIVGYAAKWDERSFEYSHTPRTFELGPGDGPLVAELQETAVRCAGLFGLRGYGRVDFRVDANGPTVLEVNVNPCISPDAGFAAAAGRAGMKTAGVVQRIIEAVRR